VPNVNDGAQLVSKCGTSFDGISASGERVFFTALHGGSCAQPAENELYARVNGAETVAISEPASEDCGGCKDAEVKAATFAGAAEDGSKVFFTSEQGLLPGAAGDSLYEYDFEAPVRSESVTRVASDITGVIRVTEDGTRVYFESEKVLTGAANGNGEVAKEGAPNLYVYDSDNGVTAFVAAGGGAKSFDATRDGGYLAFESTDEGFLGAEDSSAVPQLFEYDAGTGELTRVSIGQRVSAGYECAATGIVEEGYDCDGNTDESEYAPRMDQSADNSVSENGSVVFTSELPLAPGAVRGYPVDNNNGNLTGYAENVYEYRAGQVYLLSPGDEATPANYGNPEEDRRLFGIDESGRDVFFSSVDNLVPQDTDTQSSWYDAREGGGFPASVSSSSGCSGEACQGALGGVPSLLLPSSVQPPGNGSAVAPPLGGVMSPPRTAAQVRADKLQRALAACRRLARGRRRGCEVGARARYGTKAKRGKRK
jgi:hypothetical protein